MAADPAATRRGPDGLLRQASIMGSRPPAPSPPFAEHATTPVRGGVSGGEPILPERFMFENYIGGRWCRPAAGRYLTQASAARRSPGGSLSRSDARDISRACAAARQAAGDWVRRGRAVRRVELGQLPGRIAAQALALAMAERWDQGLPSRELDLHRAARSAAALRDIIRALPLAPGKRQRPVAVPETPQIATLVRAAEAAQTGLCRTLLPLLYDGRVAVVLLTYQDARQLPVRLLQLLGIVAAALPPGVLNVLTGLGLEAGVALMRQDRAGLAAAHGR